MAFASHGQVKTSYELPPLVEKFCSGWVGTLQSAATVAALLASVEAQLLGFFKHYLNTADVDQNIHKAILVLTYVALIFSIGATMTSLLLTDEFSEIPMRSARAEAVSTNRNSDLIMETNWKILVLWHIKPKTKLVIWHWFVSLSISLLCIVASVALFAATQEPMIINIIASIAAVISVLPLVWFMLPASTLARKERSNPRASSP